MNELIKQEKDLLKQLREIREEKAKLAGDTKFIMIIDGQTSAFLETEATRLGIYKAEVIRLCIEQYRNKRVYAK